MKPGMQVNRKQARGGSPLLDKRRFRSWQHKRQKQNQGLSMVAHTGNLFTLVPMHKVQMGEKKTTETSAL